MRKSDLYRITAYHCAHCGAPTDPNRLLCDYCQQQALLKQYVKNDKIDRMKVRMLIKTGLNYINFDQILSLDGISVEPETIDVTCLSDNKQRRIYAPPRSNFWNLDIATTIRGNELCRKLARDTEYDCRIEILGADAAFEFKALYCGASMPYFESNSLAKNTLIFDPTDFRGLIKTIVPEELTCPNCGAPVYSRLGACNYCGGWLEFEF